MKRALLAGAVVSAAFMPLTLHAQDVMTRSLIIRGLNTVPANVGTLTVETLTAPRLYELPDVSGNLLVSPTPLTPNAALRSNALGQVESVVLLDGQLLIGSTGAAPTVGTLTGTTNQITVTNGAGTITLSTPQDIHTAATPTFGGMTLNGLLDVTTGGATILGNTTINASGTATTSIGSATGGTVSMTANGDVTIDVVNSATNDLVLNNIAVLAPIEDLLWITATNEVRRAPFNGTALEGITFATGSYRLGALDGTTNPLLVDRYINADASNLYVTGNGGNTLVDFSGSDEAVGVRTAAVAGQSLTVDAPGVADIGVAVTSAFDGVRIDASGTGLVVGGTTQPNVGADIQATGSGLVIGGTVDPAVGVNVQATATAFQADGATTSFEGDGNTLLGNDATDVHTVAGTLTVNNGVNAPVSINTNGSTGNITLGDNANNDIILSSSTISISNVPVTASTANVVTRNASGELEVSNGPFVTGTGTANRMTRWATSSTIANASLTDDGAGAVAFVAGTNLDANNGLITNIGNAGTDFTAGGGLTLAGAFNANGASNLGNGDAGDIVTVNTGGGANLSISETTITRAGDVTFSVTGGTSDITISAADDIDITSGDALNLNASGGISVNTAGGTDLAISETLITRAGDWTLSATGGGGGGSDLTINASGDVTVTSDEWSVDATGNITMNGALTVGNGGAGDIITVNSGVGANVTISETTITRAGALTLSVTGGTNDLTLSSGDDIDITANDALTLATGAAGVTFNSAGGADLTITETALTRGGSIAINPGAANSVTTNGSMSVGVNLSVDGNTTLGNATGDVVTITAGTIDIANVGSSATAGSFLRRNATNDIEVFSGTLPTGSGTANTIPLWTGTGTLGNSSLTQNVGGTTVTAAASVVVNSGGAADLTIAETGVTRGGSIAVNPGAANSVTTDGSLTVGVNASVNGNTTLGDASGDAVTINAATVQISNVATSAVNPGSNMLKRLPSGAIGVATEQLAVASGSVAGRSVYWSSLNTAGSGSFTDNGSGSVALIVGGSLDANNGVITNIGAAGTDFSATGGLTLADALTVSAGGASITGGLTVPGLTSVLNMTGRTVLVNDGAGTVNTITVANLLGGMPLLYGPTTTQNTISADGATYLYDVAYSNTATGSALGGRVVSDASTFATGSATGLNVSAVANATGNATGLIVSASGGLTNVAIQATGAISATGNTTLSSANGATTTVGSSNGGSVDVAASSGNTVTLRTVNGATDYANVTLGNSSVAIDATDGGSVQASIGLDGATGATSISAANATNSVSVTLDAAANSITTSGRRINAPNLAQTGGGAISGAVDGALNVVSAFTKAEITANNSGVDHRITFAAGDDGEVAYVRISIDNNAGTGDIILDLGDGLDYTVIGAGTGENHLMHVMYSADDNRWVVFSDQLVP